MDILLSSSRGNHMDPELKTHHHNPANLSITAIPSAQLKQLLPIAINSIKSSHSPSECHIYFFAGLCDITYRDFDPHYNIIEKYDEVIYNETPSLTIDRLTNIITEISDKITSLGAKPCFATIIPCSLKIWNITRLNQFKTSFLIHHNQYEDMQTNLIKAVVEINKFIHSINIKNHMITPYTSDTVMTSTGPNSLPRIHYNRLVDGTHPTNTLRSKWISKLSDAMLKNRLRHSYSLQTPLQIDLVQSSSESDEENVEKRKWEILL